MYRISSASGHHRRKRQLLLRVRRLFVERLEDRRLLAVGDQFGLGAEAMPSGFTADVDLRADAVLENSAIGTEVGITAKAEDSDGSATVAYSLSNSAEGRFAIDPSTGVVTVASLLDAEAASEHTIEVRAVSSDQSSSVAEFTVEVLDVNEFSVGYVIDANEAPNVVLESAVPGTPVGITGSGQDSDVSDTVAYRLLVDADGRFAIDSSTGVVTVARALDAEVAASHTIRIQAVSSDTSSGYDDFTIRVADVDEYDVGDLVDLDDTLNLVPEDAPVGTLVGIVASAEDGDQSDSVWYSLVEDRQGLFSIDPLSGVVTTAGDLDAEISTSHTIQVQALSTDESSTVADFNIRVSDVDEFSIGELYDDDLSANGVLESAAIGTPVGIIALATDFDVLDSVSYALVDDAGGRFSIDSESGVVTVAAELDAESADSHSVQVRASSTDGTSAVADFVIAVADVDEFDVADVVDIDASPNAVLTSFAAGAAVGITVLAKDGDVSDETYYSLIDDDDGRFAIDSATGIVTVVGELRDAVQTDHAISVQAISTDGSTSETIFTVAVIPAGVASERPWQNPLEACDVNRDGRVSPTDVLLLINEINITGARELPPFADGELPPFYLDVNGDGRLGPADVLFVINRINESAGGAPFELENEPAGEPTAAAPPVTAPAPIDSAEGEAQYEIAPWEAEPPASEDPWNGYESDYQLSPSDADDLFSQDDESYAEQQTATETEEWFDYIELP